MFVKDLVVVDADPVGDNVLMDVATDAEATVVQYVQKDVQMDAENLAEIVVVKDVVFVKDLVAVAVDPVVDNVLMDVVTDAEANVVLLAIKNVVPVQELAEMAAELAGMFVQKDVATDAIVLVVLLVIKDAQKLVNLIVLILVKVNARDTVKGVAQMAAQKDAQLPLAFLQ